MLIKDGKAIDCGGKAAPGTQLMHWHERQWAQWLDGEHGSLSLSSCTRP